MPTFEFTKDLETGVAKIDEQHKELINRANNLMAMGSKAFSPEETEKTLNHLSDYVSHHFAEEEELQKSCNYPKYEQHKALHDGFKKEIANMKVKFHKEGGSIMFTVELTKTIVE